ncbi:MAG: hypothetical protein H6641_18405 [Caldilineaceae bacterium]|nr:hypothetical protein [Caldilineaceae bacterium]
MLPQSDVGFKTRAPAKIYRPPNKPNVVAGFQYADRLRSERGASGILRNPPAIAFDRDVIAQADANGVNVLEVFVSDTTTTYQTTLTNLYQHGRIQTRFGPQWVLSLKYWSVNGQTPEPESTPEPEQLSLFGGE